MASGTQVPLSNGANGHADPSEPIYPLAALSPEEILEARGILYASYPPNTELYFKYIMLAEPGKAVMTKWWDAGEPESSRPDRRAYVAYYLRNTDKYFDATVSLNSKKVVDNVLLGPNVHGPGDGTEIILLEKLCLEDEGVQNEIKKMGLGEDWTVLSDPWIYGSDGIGDDTRLYQCFLYARPTNQPDSNHYSLPLPISPVIDTMTLKVVRIDQMPLSDDFSLHKETPKWNLPQPNEYLPELQQSIRKDIKPYRVAQPEGPSFNITKSGGESHLIEWQKWSFRVGFNYREGIVLYNIRYDGRKLFYRLSLSDMNIPYADPRHPYHKKAAFDLGDVGAGLMANNLKLGCDCLGHIAYLDGHISDDQGKVFYIPNAICIHEQDSGISWKHINYRTNRGVIARKRELIIQSIITVSNYEYVLNWVFNQAAEVSFEVRLTGILSTQPINSDTTVPWGTVVHPQVLAAHHQHIFSLRIEPMLDGYNNSVQVDECHALPKDPKTNPHGVGFVLKSEQIATSGGFDLDSSKARVYKITTESTKNAVNGEPCGYRLQLPPMQPMLADPSSFHYKRAEFADHSLYVVKGGEGHERELYSAGWHTNQSRGGTGVRSWAARNDSVEKTDIVVYAQFGVTHVPRAEDFPVMPVETLRLNLKPANFFDRNPALDVPQSTQDFNQSTLVELNSATEKLEVGSHRQGGDVELDIGKGGKMEAHAPAQPVIALQNGTQNGSCCGTET